MAVFEITDKDFEEKVLKNKLPVLVDFYAEWCGPCKMAAPVLEELSEEYKNKISIVKVDVDKHPNLSQKYGVMSIPTTIMIKNGEEVERHIGFAGKEGFDGVINKVI